MTSETPDYSSVVSATGFLRPRASRSLSSFQTHLLESPRVLALLGAGLSASSGIPTFRGVGGVWRTHDAQQLSTPQAFEADPGLVWTFYEERRKAARAASPNAAHKALAALARAKKGFLAVGMNIDGLCERADHPPEQLHQLHGNLFDIRCSRCDYLLHAPAADGLFPSLPASDGSALDPTPLHAIRREDIPSCPVCKALLRPAIVWFSEPINRDTLSAINGWIEASSMIDTMLVIGTSAEVYPATAYIEAARRKGARVAVVNVEKEDVGLLGLGEQDWYFEGDAAVLVPEMVKEVVNNAGIV